MHTANLFRIWIPLLLCAIGIGIFAADDFSGMSVDAFAGFCGAGSAMWLINVLWRMGIEGEDDRADEAAARRYLAEHGHWPDDAAQT